MHFLTCAVIWYTDNLPVLFVINLLNILNDDIFLHTFCQTLFNKGLGWDSEDQWASAQAESVRRQNQLGYVGSSNDFSLFSSSTFKIN